MYFKHVLRGISVPGESLTVSSGISEAATEAIVETRTRASHFKETIAAVLTLFFLRQVTNETDGLHMLKVKGFAITPSFDM